MLFASRKPSKKNAIKFFADRNCFPQTLDVLVTRSAPVGTAERPVGTVCFALAADGVLVSRRHQLWGGRDWVKLLTSQLALDWVRRWALGLPVLDSGFRK